MVRMNPDSNNGYEGSFRGDDLAERVARCITEGLSVMRSRAKCVRNSSEANKFTMVGEPSLEYTDEEGGYVSTKTIKKEDKEYKVKEEYGVKKNVKYGNIHEYNRTVADVTSRFFTVTDKDDRVGYIRICQRDIIKQGDCKEDICTLEGSFDGESCDREHCVEIKLNDKTDINNINDVRYQLGKIAKGSDKYVNNVAGRLFYSPDLIRKIARDMVLFMDKFVIVSPEKRKAYRDYERQMNKEAKQRAIVSDKYIGR